MQKINLLPQELRKDPAVDLKRIIKIAAFTTIMGFFALAFISLIFNNYLKEQEIENIRTEIATLQPKVNKVEKLKNEIALNQRRITTYQNILYKPVPWPELLRDIAFNSPTDLWLTEVQTSRVEAHIELDKVSNSNTNNDNANTENNKNNNAKGDDKQVEEPKSELYFIVRGFSPSLTSVGIFILHLNQLSVLDDVTLIVAKEPEDEKIPRGLLEFEIKAKVKTNLEGGQN